VQPVRHDVLVVESVTIYTSCFITRWWRQSILRSWNQEKSTRTTPTPTLVLPPCRNDHESLPSCCSRCSSTQSAAGQRGWSIGDPSLLMYYAIHYDSTSVRLAIDVHAHPPCTCGDVTVTTSSNTPQPSDSLQMQQWSSLVRIHGTKNLARCIEYNDTSRLQYGKQCAWIHRYFDRGHTGREHTLPGSARVCQRGYKEAQTDSHNCSLNHTSLSQRTS
jgi:hypothetical protein